MALAERRAEVVWEGNLTEGGGRVSAASGAFSELPVTWAARTEQPGGKTSPEELIAAAHATCFSMALSSALNRGGTPPTRLVVSAVCTLDRVDGTPTITRSDLTVRGVVPGLDQAGFAQAAEQAHQGCPVSRALKNNIASTVTALLEA
jgi:osmotically inducible protein OsmC